MAPIFAINPHSSSILPLKYLLFSIQTRNWPDFHRIVKCSFNAEVEIKSGFAGSGSKLVKILDLKLSQVLSNCE